MNKFVVETLFYIFYNMPFDRWQSLAAQELIHKKWLFWEEKSIWVIEGISLDEEAKKKIPFSSSEWVTFDPYKWCYLQIQNIDPSKLISKITNEATNTENIEE